MSKSRIEWTDETVNPWRGCSPVSAGCSNCYAEKQAYQVFLRGVSSYGKVVETKGIRKGKWNGKIIPAFDQLQKCLSRKNDTMFFMASMTDFGHPRVPDEWRDIAIAVCSVCSGKYRNHTFQILTKHPDNLSAYFQALEKMSQRSRKELFLERINFAVNQGWLKFPKWVDKKGGIVKLINSCWPLPNIWVGVTVENQKAYNRIKHLKTIDAQIRFLSCEPLLEFIKLGSLNGIDWVIVGGESGDNARPCNIEWISNIVNQAQTQKTAVFVKQLGRNSIMFDGKHFQPLKKCPYFKGKKHSEIKCFPEHLRIRQFPKI